MWVKCVVAYEGGERVVRDFPVKAYHNTSGLHITDEPRAEVGEWLEGRTYLVSVYVNKSK